MNELSKIPEYKMVPSESTGCDGCTFRYIREALKWALSNINCEPFEWSDEESADAHKAALALVGEQT